MKFPKSNALRKVSHKLIPGGAHTYSKGDDQFPAMSPGFIVRGKGAYIWDVDGNKFLDWGMGLRSVVLGHAYQPVVNAVKKQLKNGVNFPRPSILEIELAQKIRQIIPSAEMVKFNKNGSAATSAAVKLARAYTKRDVVAMPVGSYNGSDDWGMAATAINAGIPESVKKLTVTFEYNNLESVQNLFKKYPDKIACFILEPASEVAPENNFLQNLQKLCKQNGTILIFDEMITGFRWHLKGAQHVYKVTPDLSTFGKAMVNGFSLAALVGKKEIMQLGGMYGKHERVFLLSSTHGAETHALAAAIKTIDEIKNKNVVSYIDKIGQTLKKKLNKIIKEENLEEIFNIFGAHGSRMALAVKETQGYTTLQIKTYFSQEMIQQGVLFNGYFAPSFAHKNKEVDKTAKAWRIACKKLTLALKQRNLEKLLIGKPIKPVFRKFN